MDPGERRPRSDARRARTGDRPIRGSIAASAANLRLSGLAESLVQFRSATIAESGLDEIPVQGNTEDFLRDSVRQRQRRQHG
jgi:hypothetical protein